MNSTPGPASITSLVSDLGNAGAPGALTFVKKA